MAPAPDDSESGTEENLPDSSLKVVCRVRPSIGNLSSCEADAVSVLGNVVEVVSDNKGTVGSYQFDTVLNAVATQKEVYESAAWDLVESVLDGYDGALLCYGQTGGGKTYTLEGNLDESPRAGILPRAAYHIFGVAAKDLTNVVVTVSYVEIYLEKIQDLLAEKWTSHAASQNLNIRELDDRGPRVQGCREVRVTSPKELLKLARLGASRRHVAATRMNDRSSRSHSIFSINVTHTDPEDGRLFDGTLHLVDLAGSERQLQARSEGSRLNEARTINRSLSNLGNVIVALADAQEGRHEALNHVPYRNSKLTWLLREALGGSAQAVLVLAVSPSMADRRETLSSLRFGSRAMRVDNQPLARIAPGIQLQLACGFEEDPSPLPAFGRSKLDDPTRLGHSASTSSTATASTTSLGMCSASSAADCFKESCGQLDAKDSSAEALVRAFGSLGASNFDSRSLMERFLSMREQIAHRNDLLAKDAPCSKHLDPPTPHRPSRKWHASIAYDFSAGGQPKLRAQLFEACELGDSSEHRLMMEMSAEEFSTLPLHPGLW
jgi:kinesin family protein 5